MTEPVTDPAKQVVQFGCGLMLLGIALAFILPVVFIGVLLIFSQF